jgi:Kef-type K+ transport system membrane component KefB
MAELSVILLHLFVIYLAAKVAGEVFERLGQPQVIGELLAGVVIGPYALGLIGTPGPGMLAAFHGDPAAAQEGLSLVYRVIAELGVIVLLFSVGLETRVSDLLRVGPRALLVGALGIAVPFGLGLWYMSLQPTQQLTDAFTATSLVATSIGITARVMRDLGVLATTEARIILGAAVIDDILAMLLLAVVVALAGGGTASPVGLGLLLAQAVGFVLFVVLVGTHAVGRYSVHLERLRIEDAPFALAIALTLGLAALSGTIGLAAIIGAFLAGMVLAEAQEQYQLEDQVRPLYQFLVPFFFVLTGAQVNLAVFADRAVLGLASVLTALAIVGKLVGGGIGAWGIVPGEPLAGKLRRAAVVGVGMVPRGEVGLIVASIGLSRGAIPEAVFSAVVIMSIVTTVLAPPLLKLLYLRWPAGEDAEAEPASESPPAAPAEV